ncbi:MAG: hypothetical protein L0Z53_07770 [Acidobacteriales bacterium]|nr:hypothetical protein [Terriglobales bacterium]
MATHQLVPLPAQPLSAVDAITPAVDRARRQLFAPFRPGFWWRLAVLAIFTGEVSSGGGINFPSDFNLPKQSERGGASELVSMVRWDWDSFMQALPWLIALAFLGVVLLLLFLYVHSVLRFVLFESVLTGECSLRQGWVRWRAIGSQYFLWLIAFQFVVLMGFALLIGLPLLLAWQQGILRAPKEHMPLLIAGGFVLLLVLLVLSLLIAAVNALAKDFVVPIMALENVNAIEGWRRLLARISASKGSYAGYLGMKLLLAIGIGIATAIINLIIILILLLPAGLAIFLLIALKNPGTIVLGIVFGIIAIFLIFALVAIVAVPVAAFFQAYALYFFGSRYDRLADLLWPPPPPQVETPPLSPAPAPA